MRNIKIIPSKSVAHRALICSALSKNPCTIKIEEASKDIEATEKCLTAFVEGASKMACGESGSTLRFLLPVMGALGYTAEFYPEGRLPQRPLSPLYEELASHGCRLSKQGNVPFIIEGQLQPGTYTIPGNVSSQYISGLLFALPILDGDSKIIIDGKLESASYVALTLDVLKTFSVDIEETDQGYMIKGNQSYKGPDEYKVEGDWSNGAFWLVAGALLDDGLSCQGLRLDSLQGDRKILEILKEMGAVVEADSDRIKVSKGHLHGINIDGSQIPDLIPIISVLGAAAEGTTVIHNAERLRLKESDRLKAVAQVLGKIGADIKETKDGLIIKGKMQLRGALIDSYNDHRIAMMAAIASLISKNKVIISNWEAVNKSYPKFFEEMKIMGIDGNVERI